MIHNRACECCADVTVYSMHFCNAREQRRTGRTRVSILKVAIGFDMKKLSPPIQIPALRRSSPSVSRGYVGGASKSDIPSRFVASKFSQSVDVQRYCLETVMPFAFSTRSRTELNLEMLVVAAMLAESS